ncbi:hypothetical protein [uncultured Vagococcus sp.]|uniref:hypothetical protein n=1 Tax=uncultured Vagococcus sp. TaxID=189676 RepID=UPI0028D2DB85|nr:hypothetical protein [uncultured Vagococcus sp.]
MKNVKCYLNKMMLKFILNYSGKVVFSSCCHGRCCQKKITADLKSSLKAAYADR